MPAARGVKRAASKASSSNATASSSSSAPKLKKKRGPIQLDVPKLGKGRCSVLACGQGDVGQLGLRDSVPETTKFKHVASLGDKIVEVCAGGMHTVALDTDGKVWTFGCNDEGALGRPTSGDDEEGTPTLVSLPEKAVAISAGDSHTAAVLEDGRVFAWGAFRDSHGSMGLILRGREGKPCKEPVQIDIGELAVAVASGSDHLVILGASGAVQTLGCGEQGQLGRLSQRSASRDARGGFSALLAPAKVSLKLGASRIWAGFHATFVLDSSGETLHAFGLNNYGQLGISGENRRSAIYLPTECDAFNAHTHKWKDISCGQHHTVALDSEGTVFTIGRREYGRLGLGDVESDALVPTAVPKLQGVKCVSVAAGTATSYAVTESGILYSWGMGSEGQLGTGGRADASSPAPAATPAPPGPPAAAAAPRVAAAAAGGQHAVCTAELSKRARTPSPLPKPETSESKVDSESDKPSPAKKQKVEPVTSTSDVPDNADKKVNGDEKIETAMEVDDPDRKKATDKQATETTAADKPETQSEPIKMEEDTPPIADAEMTEKKDEKPLENGTVEEKVPEKEIAKEKVSESNTESTEMSA